LGCGVAAIRCRHDSRPSCVERPVTGMPPPAETPVRIRKLDLF
jgi:hypothetical protein